MIMDDNKIMEAAKLIANSSAALIEAMGMMSENIERANRGESLAYTEEAFNKVVMNNGIDYNSVMSRVGYEKWRRTMGKEVKIDVGYKDVLEKSLSAIQYLRIHGFSTYMESEGIVNRIMMFKDKNEMGDQKIRSI